MQMHTQYCPHNDGKCEYFHKLCISSQHRKPYFSSKAFISPYMVSRLFESESLMPGYYGEIGVMWGFKYGKLCTMHLTYFLSISFWWDRYAMSDSVVEVCTLIGLHCDAKIHWVLANSLIQTLYGTCIYITKLITKKRKKQHINGQSQPPIDIHVRYPLLYSIWKTPW